jgi:uncharacterized SAM-binding protein YcdF (DUF218 family)
MDVSSGRRRRWRVVAGAIAALLVAFIVTTAALFVRPSTDRPRAADAVVVLGGDGSRLAEGEALVREGVTRTLAVSVGSAYDPCFHRHEPFTLICFQAHPLTTQGEARWLGSAARADGWHHVVVVVSAAQATRARIRIRRCYSSGLQVVAVRLGVARTIRDAVYEWGALLKALTLQRGC